MPPAGEFLNCMSYHIVVVVVVNTLLRQGANISGQRNYMRDASLAMRAVLFHTEYLYYFLPDVSSSTTLHSEALQDTV